MTTAVTTCSLQEAASAFSLQPEDFIARLMRSEAIALTDIRVPIAAVRQIAGDLAMEKLTTQETQASRSVSIALNPITEEADRANGKSSKQPKKTSGKAQNLAQARGLPWDDKITIKVQKTLKDGGVTAATKKALNDYLFAIDPEMQFFREILTEMSAGTPIGQLYSRKIASFFDRDSGSRVYQNRLHPLPKLAGQILAALDSGVQAAPGSEAAAEEVQTEVAAVA